mgnify:CR=1 FL=1
MTQIFNRGGSLRYDMKGKKRKNHLANPLTKPQTLLSKQNEVSPEVIKEDKRKQEERELAKQDFFERLKKSVGSTTKQETKVYSGERKLMGIATMHKSNAVPVFEDDKKLAKDIAKMRR